jgi:phosphoglycolate phosphatase-like HAD superfamily hydrolase
MRELVADLKAAGVKQAIATSKKSKALEPQLEAFGWTGEFHPIVTPDVLRCPKPHPESLEVCLDAHGLRPEEALMVGDTLYDLDMANAAHVPCVGVTHGFATKDQLSAASPMACAADVAELRGILFGLLEPFPLELHGVHRLRRECSEPPQAGSGTESAAETTHFLVNK